MKISIVIPVYNEAEALSACLSAIAAQVVPPLEVIVVDNNSTDNTLAVAQAFEFVRLLREPRQGVVYARTRGFNAARGDIIARIDADTVLPPTWTTSVRRIFADPAVAAVSGAPHYYDFALAGVADGIDRYIRVRLARRLRDTNFLWGANMALRQSAWRQVRGRLCERMGLHEDFDLAIHLQDQGSRVVYDESLEAGVSSRRIDSSFTAYARYTLASPRTYAVHGLRSRRHMYSVVLICWALYIPARLIYRSYDPATGVVSLSQLLGATTASRVDPTIHVA